MSERCSGEIDPFSDSSVLAAECEELVPLGRAICRWEGSNISPRACTGRDVAEPFFPFRGLTIGDCRTPRTLRGFGGAFLLDFLDKITELAGAEWESKFISIGEFVVPECLDSYTVDCSFCACRAGELRGLKYAPGIVYSGILKCASRGVTAGETNGVKAIYDMSVEVLSSIGTQLTSCSLACIRYLSYIARC